MGRAGRKGTLGEARWEGWMSLMLYGLCSISLNVANKMVFSAATFHYPWLTITIQSLMASVILTGVVVLSRSFGHHIQLRFKPQLILELLKPSICFTMFLVSNAYALHFMSLPMLTIFKSFAPLGITLCETIFKSESISRPMCGALLLMVISNAVSISSDIDSSVAGYIAATCSVVANIAQLFTLGYGISKEWGVTEKAIWANILQAVLTLPVALAMGEGKSFLADFSQLSMSFKMLYFGSGVMGCLISFSLYWATSVTRGSYVSFVGASTKIPIVLLGYLMFETKITLAGWVGIAMGLAAGLVFTYVQQEEKAKKEDPEPVCGSSSDEEELSQVKLNMKLIDEFVED